MEVVCDLSTAEALDALDADLAGLQAAGVTPVDVADARALTVRVESLARRVRSVQVQLVAEIDRFHAGDGHVSAKVMVRHVANLSTREASRRARVPRHCAVCRRYAVRSRRGGSVRARWSGSPGLMPTRCPTPVRRVGGDLPRRGRPPWHQ